MAVPGRNRTLFRCVFGGTSSWTPIKTSTSRVRAADSDTSDDNISLDDYLSLNYQPVHGVPGFEIETADNTFGLQLLIALGLVCS